MGHFQQLLCNSCPKAPSGFANWSYLAVVSCMRGALRTLLCWNEDWQVTTRAMKPQLCENLEPRDVTPPSPGQKSSALLLEPHTPTKGGFQELWVQSQAQSQLPWLPPCPGCAGQHQSSSQGLFLKFVSIKAHKQFLRRKPNFPHWHFLRGLCFIWRTFGFALHPFEVSYYQSSAVR